MDLEKIIERLEPYDPSSSSKDDFLNQLKSFPELKESLKLQLASKDNSEWLAKVENGKIYFKINDDRWKLHIRNRCSPTLSLKLISPERVPIISIDML